MREKSIAKILEMKDITNNITESIVLKKFNKDIKNVGINKKSKSFGENNWGELWLGKKKVELEVGV